MKKTTTVYSSEFEVQAQKIVSLAFVLCESRVQANKGNITPELKMLSAATLSLEKAIAVFITTERLCK